uniref:Putative reverse transcriptase domain-containing protein n=1 Tax=Tanacetum cinerariifolium TaxID=118510 RepID=A0A699K5A4_TANCI|nr:putative reverse transcriptase domain-containing protein [Tanacetum cinerariifolium]
MTAMTQETCGRRKVSTVRECTYTDFLKCQPMNFKGTEGVVSLTEWLEKMESVFHISNCTITCQVGGLLDMIHRSVKTLKPKTMQEAIEFATELIDKKILTLAERLAENKRKNKILTFHGDESNNGHESRLKIITCTKTQKYLLKGCPIFLAHVTMRKAKDKSREKRLEDVPIVQDFLKVFPKDLSGIPPTRQVEFQIDLIHGAAPVARAPYRLAPSEMKELSDQLKNFLTKAF